MRCAFMTLLCIVIANAGIIHPQLAEKLELIDDNERLQVIVHMKNKADLSLLGGDVSKADKIYFLQDYAENEQRQLISYLTGCRGEVTDVKAYWIFNGLTFKATKNVIESVASREDVEYVINDFWIMLHNSISESKESYRTIEWNISKVKAPECWSLGIDGNGIIVGNIDTGVDVSHPALIGKWIYGGWFDAVNGQSYPYDDQGHGTHTMGTLCGGDAYGWFPDDIGVASGSYFICAKGFTPDSGAASWLHACFDWFASQEVDVISNSWGSNDNTRLEFWDDCQNLRDLGFILVFSIGNAGPSGGSAGTPGNFPTVIGVGATDIDDDVRETSSRGPAPNLNPWNNTTYWGRPDWNLIKPDISAPGENIRSSLPGGSYGTKNGTSMACPHVAGAVAMCLQMDPNIDYNTMYKVMLDYGDRPSQGVPYPNNNYGWGRLNCRQMIDYITSCQPDNLVKPWWGTNYIGNGIYNTTGSGQTVLQFADPNQWATHHVKIENDGNAADIYYVKATDQGTGTWTIRYFDALSGGNDITSQITSGEGWVISRYAGQCREIRAEVKPGNGMNGLEKIVYITTQSKGVSGDKTDVAKLRTQCNVLRPDNLIKNSNESTYIGNNIYNTTGQGQTKNQNTRRNRTVTYHLKIENDGETYDLVWITGPGGDAHWTIRYFDDITGGSEITDGVVNGTYWLYLPGTGACEYLRVEVTPTPSCPYETQKEILVTATAGYNASKKDAVKAVTKCTNYNSIIDGTPSEDEGDKIFTFNLGEESALGINIKRQGYKILGPENYHSFDFDSCELMYRIPLPPIAQTQFRLEWTYYHEEGVDVHMRLLADDVVIQNTTAKSNSLTVESAWFPETILDDNVIVLRVQKIAGPIAVLSGIRIHGKGNETTSSTQGHELLYTGPFQFEAVYPNPAQGIIHVRFMSPDQRQVMAKLYDVSGRVVEKICDGPAHNGLNEIQYNGAHLASGVYFLRAQAGEALVTEKVIFQR